MSGTFIDSSDGNDNVANSITSLLSDCTYIG